jgi:deoxycytidylate deaminase
MAKKLLKPKPRAIRAKQSVISNPELIFGLVGPIGVDVDAVVEALKRSLNEVGYNPIVIHLTEHMRDKRIRTKLDFSTYYDRYQSLISYANSYRKRAKNPAALAGLSILRIRAERISITRSLAEPALGTAYIVRQFKRPEEIEMMRRVYGRKFVQVSIFGSAHDRRGVLIEKIRRYESSPKTDADCERQAIELIDIDHNQKDDANGQRLSDVFHLGDVFVDGIDASKANDTIERFIRAFFGDTKSSPSKDEYGLYIAAAAALRSVDLSRQVGAAIFSKQGEIISLGCNEVPKAGGGTYWIDDPAPIYRDVELGIDTNYERKTELLHDLIDRMSFEKLFSRKFLKLKTQQRKVSYLLSKSNVKDSQIMDIIEFGRMIHAEMSAISDAARLGRTTKGASLYCTTFPCHLCAKHIVAAGIDRVVFLEPYPKSYAQKLHSDSITFEADVPNKVAFKPFIGISPRRYRDIFEKKKRKKDDGRAKVWYEDNPTPLIEDRSPAYIENEEPFAYVALRGLQEQPGRRHRPKLHQ